MTRVRDGEGRTEGATALDASVLPEDVAFAIVTVLQRTWRLRRLGTCWNRVCNAKRYAFCMTQLVTRVDEQLVAAIDAMVDSGMVASRSDAVRLALTRLVDQQTRADIGARIVKGYVQTPQTDEEFGWTEAATARMIAEEPW